MYEICFVIQDIVIHKYDNSIAISDIYIIISKYRKSYCNHPGVGLCVGASVAQMFKFLVKVFISLYLLNMVMDQVDTLHVSRYWSEVLCSTIMKYPG